MKYNDKNSDRQLLRLALTFSNPAPTMQGKYFNPFRPGASYK
jgi:hypothetical protein